MCRCIFVRARPLLCASALSVRAIERRKELVVCEFGAQEGSGARGCHAHRVQQGGFVERLLRHICHFLALDRCDAPGELLIRLAQDGEVDGRGQQLWRERHLFHTVAESGQERAVCREAEGVRGRL